jgi:flagellar hook-basal body complex protein FliE
MPTAESLHAGDSGFAEMIARGLEAVSGSEQRADALIEKLATGGDVQPHEVMIATSEAQLSVQMAVAVRDAAIGAYREIMNLQL